MRFLKKHAGVPGFWANREAYADGEAGDECSSPRRKACRSEFHCDGRMGKLVLTGRRCNKKIREAFVGRFIMSGQRLS